MKFTVYIGRKLGAHDALGRTIEKPKNTVPVNVPSNNGASATGKSDKVLSDRVDVSLLHVVPRKNDDQGIIDAKNK